MISLKNIYKSTNSNHILEDINLNIERSKTTVILGPSGCGKTSLLRLINGLDLPTSGSIHVDNVELSPKTLLEIRKKIGFVFQNFNLFPHLSILQNLTYAPLQLGIDNQDVIINAALDVLKDFGLHDKAALMPSSLSGGQKQRVAIARALMQYPKIVLFDEPTSALDLSIIKDLLEILIKLKTQSLTMLIVTHHIGFAKIIADYIIFMDKGKIIEHSAAESFFVSPQTAIAQKYLEDVKIY